jgi:hypothetical protein
MCEKCNHIGETIDRARRLASGITDQLTTERLKAMIEDLQIQKTALHPEPEKLSVGGGRYHSLNNTIG